MAHKTKQDEGYGYAEPLDVVQRQLYRPSPVDANKALEVDPRYVASIARLFLVEIRLRQGGGTCPMPSRERLECAQETRDALETFAEVESDVLDKLEEQDLIKSA